MDNEKIRDEENRDKPREKEGHPVATGVGVIGGGAAGAAIGTAVGGPVGTAVGAVIGAVAGGAGGYAVGEAIDPAAEDAYWRESHYRQPFAKSGTYDEYEPGYRSGYQGYDKYAPEKHTFEEAEPDLQRDYGESETELPWEKARDASRAAWNRVERGEAVRRPATDEQKRAGRRDVKEGSFNEDATAERVNEPVEVEDEDIVVERTGAIGEDVVEDRFQEGEVRIPPRREEQADNRPERR